MSEDPYIREAADRLCRLREDTANLAANGRPLQNLSNDDLRKQLQGLESVEGGVEAAEVIWLSTDSERDAWRDFMFRRLDSIIRAASYDPHADEESTEPAKEMFCFYKGLALGWLQQVTHELGQEFEEMVRRELHDRETSEG